MNDACVYMYRRTSDRSLNMMWWYVLNKGLNHIQKYFKAVLTEMINMHVHAINQGQRSVQLSSSLIRNTPPHWSVFIYLAFVQVVFSHANQPKIFYSTDEGSTWNSRTFSISTIDSRTLIWNTRHDQWALAHDITNNIVCELNILLSAYSISITAIPDTKSGRELDEVVW